MFTIKKGDNCFTISSRFESQIAIAVKNASIAAGRPYSDKEAQQFATDVHEKLSSNGKLFEYSGRMIPEVRDVEEIVLKVFNERNIKFASETISRELDISYKDVEKIVGGIIPDI